MNKGKKSKKKNAEISILKEKYQKSKTKIKDSQKLHESEVKKIAAEMEELKIAVENEKEE